MLVVSLSDTRNRASFYLVSVPVFVSVADALLRLCYLQATMHVWPRIAMVLVRLGLYGKTNVEPKHVCPLYVLSSVRRVWLADGMRIKRLLVKGRTSEFCCFYVYAISMRKANEKISASYVCVCDFMNLSHVLM